MLDSDEDGLISVNKINILNLDNLTIDILTPFLLFIEETNAILTYDQFEAQIEPFLQKLDVQSRNFIIGPIRSHFKHEYEDPEPSPQISLKSRELAEKSLNRNITRGSCD